MRYVELYIADQKVDLDNQSFILYNYTMEDLSNPTIVKNSFSKQITLQGTERNNEIFGAIYRMDRVSTYTTGSIQYGTYYSASKKTPFVIYNEMSEIVESGYVKLDEVVKKDNDIEYKITLYGGLGSFFYGLMYNEDGSKRSLAGMRFQDAMGTYQTSFNKVGGFNRFQIEQAWKVLENPSQAWRQDWLLWNVVNFAPAYNGFIDGFDANKAVMTEEKYYNVDTFPIIEGAQCTFKTGTSSTLATFSNKHDMWELKDIRWYLLRPVINVKSLLYAIADPKNNGGYGVVLELDELEESLSLTESWITLPMIKMEDRGKENVFDIILSGTKSPAEYLISLAKILGLVFINDKSAKQVTIRQRKDFYTEHQNDIIDLTSRVDISSLSIKPVLGDSHFYQMGGGAIGEWATQYKEDYGIEYGIQRINTGNEFNLDTKKITDGIVYKDGVDVQERGYMYMSDGYMELYDEESNTFEARYFLLPYIEEVKMQYFTTNKQEEKETRLGLGVGWTAYYYDNEHRNVDWLPKLQLHGKDNKSEEGVDVLLLFNGIKNAPVFTQERFLEYFITDDTNDMLVLNDNTPCWNLTNANSIAVTKIPSFRRHKTRYDGIAEYPVCTWEWGQPRERGVLRFNEGDAPTIYNKFWKRYLTDRYDDDTFVLKCKVDFRGMNVGQELLGRFFYYEGAIFVLNAISNHSLTTRDLTECEFVRVQDINNYTK